MWFLFTPPQIVASKKEGNSKQTTLKNTFGAGESPQVCADRSVSADCALRWMKLPDQQRAGLALRSALPLSISSASGCTGRYNVHRLKSDAQIWRRKSHDYTSGGCRSQRQASVPPCWDFKWSNAHPPVDFAKLCTLLRPAVDWGDWSETHIWMRAGPTCP